MYFLLKNKRSVTTFIYLLLRLVSFEKKINGVLVIGIKSYIYFFVFLLVSKMQTRDHMTASICPFNLHPVK